MAKTLCRVAGGGKPLKGNAEAGDVLAGKTFSNKQSNALTGSMPNNGAWSSSTSGAGIVTIPAGYHNGSGGVDCSGAYNAGVAAADARVNTSSASYNSGYTNGINSVNIDFFCLWAFESNSANLRAHGYSLRNSLNKNGGNIVSVGDFGWYGYYNGEGENTRHGSLTAKVNCTVVSNKGTWNLNAGQHVAVSIANGNNGSGQWEGYAYAR